MNPLFSAALEVQRFFDGRGWQFCIIGGLAVVRWGQPRATQDVDLSLLTGLGNEAAFVDEIFGEFEPRISDGRNFALRSRVVLAVASNGIPLDIALAAFPYEAQVIARASHFDYAADCSLKTASAEDIVVLKAFAGRDQDWSDVEGVLIRQRDRLDWPYVLDNLRKLCQLKDDLSSLDRVQRLYDES